MRYYRIELSDPKTGKVTRVFTSFVKGATDPGALNVELDIYVAPFALPLGNAYVRVWGISLQDVGQASNFTGQNIKIFGGMQAGLPLANPKQAGLLVQGSVWQCFGNWQGVVQTLDFILISNTGSPVTPVNITFNWKAGTPLAQALATTLKIAFPTYAQSITISSDLVLNHDEPGFYQSMPQFAQYVKGVSQDIMNTPAYAGVDIVLQENKISIYDGTTPTMPKQLAFTDLIGQPTWLTPGQIQVKTVMRADLSVSDYIKLPPGQFTTTSSSFPQYRDASVQQGAFQIDQTRHVGNFRQPDGNSWVSIYNCHPVLNA